jgi:uncharacterized membrane protein YccF (DUF307 family)
MNLSNPFFFNFFEKRNRIIKSKIKNQKIMLIVLLLISTLLSISVLSAPTFQPTRMPTMNPTEAPSFIPIIQVNIADATFNGEITLLNARTLNSNQSIRNIQGCQIPCFQDYKVYQSFDASLLRFFPERSNCVCADYSFYTETGKSTYDNSVQIESVNNSTVKLDVGNFSLNYYVKSGSVLGISAENNEMSVASSPDLDWLVYLVLGILGTGWILSSFDMVLMQDWKRMEKSEAVYFVMMNGFWFFSGLICVIVNLTHALLCMIFGFSDHSKALLRYSSFVMFPFGKQIESEAETEKISMLWLIFGYIPTALLHLLFALIFALTFFGFPLAKKHIECTKYAKSPFNLSIKTQSPKIHEPPNPANRLFAENIDPKDIYALNYS